MFGYGRASLGTRLAGCTRGGEGFRFGLGGCVSAVATCTGVQGLLDEGACGGGQGFPAWGGEVWSWGAVVSLEECCEVP